MSWANDILDAFENKNNDIKTILARVKLSDELVSLLIGGKVISRYVFLCSGVFSDKGHILKDGDLVIVARDDDKFYVLGKVMV